MTDQNQGQAQVNWQPVMGGNPYDLVDNKWQTVENTEVSSVDTVVAAPNNINVPVVEQVQQPVQQQSVASVQSEQTVNQPVQPVVNQSVPVKEYKWPGGFTKKLVSFLAKLSGQPDPETWTTSPVAAPANNAVVTTQPGQAPVESAVPAAKAANPFDSIMWWVTGFLDKVESKMESAAWVDLDAPINKPVEQVPVASVVSVAVPENKPVEQKIEPVVQQPVQEEIKEEQKIEQKTEETTVKISTETPAVEAAKIEIDAVEKNENVSVNPISENIQFGESKPAQ